MTQHTEIPNVDWVKAKDVPADWEGRPVWRYFPGWRMPECAPFHLEHFNPDSDMWLALAKVPRPPLES